MSIPLAVQLYTFRDLARPGASGLTLDRATLESIASIGYLGVETVDVPGGDPGAARRALGEVGLRIASAHTWAKPDDPAGFDRAAAGLAELGAATMIVSGSGFTSAAAVDAFADRLNAAATVAARHGLTLGYHNHSAEMHPIDGIPTYRRLRDRLDPSVAFQVDIFWVVVGGAEPAAVIADLDERVVSLHIKDGVALPSDAASGEPFVNVAIGQGVVDPATAIAAAEASPSIEWLIVEFDYCDGPPLDAVRDSYAYLTTRGPAQGRAG